MKISSISDIHIHQDNDSRALLLKSFLSSKEVQDSTHIVLLGDIFDLMVGNKHQYIKKYETTFKAIKKAAKNKKLIYISGNHDFSIANILNEYFKDIDFLYAQKPTIIKDEKKSRYLSHGDEVDLNEISYQRWKSLYTNNLFQKMIDYILPFALINKLGHDASEKSKKRSIKSFDYVKAERKYIKDLNHFKSITKADYYILGHTHIEYLDSFTANNGFVPIHKKFVYYDGKSITLVSLR
jgi:UDP-2,3-diacylglucosamine hydrolase